MNDGELRKLARTCRHLARRAAGDRAGGRAVSPTRGAGLAFADVRAYVEGDDPRTIDWNVTARAGRPFVKQFTEERERVVWIVADVSGSTDFGTAGRTKRDRIGELAALLAYAAAFGHDRPGLLLVTDQVERHEPPGRGLAHAGRLAVLALRHRPGRRSTRLRTAFDRLIPARRGLVYVLSDFQDDEIHPSFRILARRHAVTAVVVSDPAERELPMLGWLDVIDAETDQRLTIDTESDAVRRNYAEAARRRSERGRHDLRSAGARVIELSTTTGIDETLARSLFR